MRRVTVLLLLLSIALAGCSAPPASEGAGASAGAQARQSSAGSDGSDENQVTASPSTSGAIADGEQQQDNVASAPPSEDSDSLPPADPGSPDEEPVPGDEEEGAEGQGDQSWKAGEGQFLDAVGTAWLGDVPDEATVLEIGRRACEQIEAGTQLADVNVVEGSGDLRDQNNDMSRLAALHLLCPGSVRF